MTDQERRDFIDGLRQVADFFEQHPSVPMPQSDMTINVFVSTREEMATIARVSKWDKIFDNNFFMLRKSFGPLLLLDVNAWRDVICKQVSKGTRIVPAKPEEVIPAQPEREEEVFEWVCDEPLLGGSK